MLDNCTPEGNTTLPMKRCINDSDINHTKVRVVNCSDNTQQTIVHKDYKTLDIDTLLQSTIKELVPSCPERFNIGKNFLNDFTINDILMQAYGYNSDSNGRPYPYLDKSVDSILECIPLGNERLITSCFIKQYVQPILEYYRTKYMYKS